MSGYCISKLLHDDFKNWEHCLFITFWPILWLEEIIIDWIYD